MCAIEEREAKLHSRAELAELVKALREEAGLSQRELAKRLGKWQSDISRAENYEEGDPYTQLRLTIIKKLRGTPLEGPLWREHDP